MPAIDIESPDDMRRLAEGFERALKDYDAARGDGKSLSTVWEDCMSFHNDNAMLRTNFYELQVILQSELQSWAGVRADVARFMEELRGRKKQATYLDRLEPLVKVNDTLVRTIMHIAKTIKETKREVRQTEFQSRFYFHANLVQQFMTGVTAILFKHLQSSDKLEPILADLRRLMRLFEMQGRGDD